MPFEIGHGLVATLAGDRNEPRARRRKKGERESGICSRCGFDGPITSDHVIAKNLFRTDADALIEMPLCDGCHAEKNQGEERLRDVIAIDVGGSDHPEALRQLLTTIRAHNRRPGRSTRRISQRRQIEVVNPDGIYLGDAFEIDWDFAPVLRTLEIAVRCLYRYFRGELFPPNSPVEVVFIEPMRRAAVVKHVSRFRPRDLIVLGDGIAHIASYGGSDDDPTATLWTITFNYGVLFVAATGSGVETFRRTTRR